MENLTQIELFEKSLDTVDTVDTVENNINDNKNIKKIKFNTHYHGISNSITIDKDKLEQWKNVSEFIDVIMNTYHENEILELDIYNVVDIYSLVLIFNFFDTLKVSNIQTEYKQQLLIGLAYFGIKSDILNSIKKGYGLVWKLCDIDIDINNKEKELKSLINNINLTNDNTISNKLNEIDNDIMLNKDNYNILYENLHNNYPVINKLYETVNSHHIIYPEFDLSFIKQEFEKHSNNIFNDLEDCVITGGMVSKHFTYNSYFIDTDYDVFILTKNNDREHSEKRAIEIIKILFERLNSKMKTYIIKTKNTITLYNSKYEVQIITKFYKNIADIFTSFDLDSCCVGYSKGNFYGLPRFIRSLAYSGNILDPKRQSPSYIHRLKKYIKRGFTLYVPGLKKNDVDYNKDNYIVRKLREKTDRFEKDSDYCDFFVLMKNRDNKEINEVLDHFHKKNKYLDTFEIKNINEIGDNVKINWNNINSNNNKYIDLYSDMYNSNYII